MFLNNIKSVFTAPESTIEDRGEMSSTLILTALFAVAATAIGAWMFTAFMNAGADVARCIEGSGAFSASSTENCKKKHKDGKDGSQTDSKSFTKSSDYTTQYG